MTGEDHHTNTEADAGAYERVHFMPADDRPDPGELDHNDPWRSTAPHVAHSHIWLPPISLCACCGVAKTVETEVEQ